MLLHVYILNWFHTTNPVSQDHITYMDLRREGHHIFKPIKHMVSQDKENASRRTLPSIQGNCIHGIA